MVYFFLCNGHHQRELSKQEQRTKLSSLSWFLHDYDIITNKLISVAVQPTAAWCIHGAFYDFFYIQNRLCIKRNYERLSYKMGQF